MRTVFILLLALALTAICNVGYATEGELNDCSQYKKLPSEEIFCTAIYEPICGSDGKTYSNKCSFCYEVKKTDDKLKFIHSGEC